MKTQNDTAKAVKKTKKERAKKLFFLYSESKGFLKYDDDGKPVFNSTCKFASFTEKKIAVFAASFFKQIGVADDIAIFTKIG